MMMMTNTEHNGTVDTLILQDFPDGSMRFEFCGISDTGNIAIDTHDDHDIIHFYGSKKKYTFKRFHKDIIDTRKWWKW